MITHNTQIHKTVPQNWPLIMTKREALAACKRYGLDSNTAGRLVGSILSQPPAWLFLSNGNKIQRDLVPKDQLLHAISHRIGPHHTRQHEVNRALAIYSKHYKLVSRTIPQPPIDITRPNNWPSSMSTAEIAQVIRLARQTLNSCVNTNPLTSVSVGRMGRATQYDTQTVLAALGFTPAIGPATNTPTQASAAPAPATNQPTNTPTQASAAPAPAATSGVTPFVQHVGVAHPGSPIYSHGPFAAIIITITPQDLANVSAKTIADIARNAIADPHRAVVLV